VRSRQPCRAATHIKIQHYSLGSSDLLWFVERQQIIYSLSCQPSTDAFLTGENSNGAARKQRWQ
jgi:hypothetical protein